MNENEKDDNRSFWQGLAVGLASSCAILLVVFGSVKIYQTYRVYGRLASGSSAETESVANEKTTEKLGVLENTIKQYFWQDVDESTLEEGVYKGLLESLDDPYSVYYTHDELVQLPAARQKASIMESELTSARIMKWDMSESARSLRTHRQKQAVCSRMTTFTRSMAKICRERTALMLSVR